MMIVMMGHLGGTSNDELTMSAVGALNHDLGKIDPLVLWSVNLPRALTETEMAEVKKHPSLGAELAVRLGLPEETMSIIRDHHERLDGSGYPGEKTAKDLGSPVRIAAIADIYDAMRDAKRSYRTPASHEEAAGELARLVNMKKIDGVLAVKFIELMKEGYGQIYEKQSNLIRLVGMKNVDYWKWKAMLLLYGPE
jgi:HD-GYP domain-containing protein (c-di-GMP phosphodiesterase class II)